MLTRGRLIKEARKRLGMTQADLADKVGVSQAALSRWEADKASPSQYTLIQLRAALPGLSAAVNSAEGMDAPARGCIINGPHGIKGFYVGTHRGQMYASWGGLAEFEADCQRFEDRVNEAGSRGL